MSTLQKQNKAKLWSAYFLLIAAANLLFGCSLQFFNATTALYVQTLGGNATFSGMMLTMFTVAATVMRIVSGRFLDKKGRCVVIAVGAAIFAAASISFKISYLPWLPVARIIQGIGYSLCTTGVSVAITDVLPRERMGEGIGYFGLTTSLSQAVGPAIAMALCAKGDYSPVFYAAFACTIVSGAAVFFSKYEKNEKVLALKREAAAASRDAAASTQQKGSFIWNYFEKTAIKPTLISTLISLPTGAIVAFLMLYAKTLNLEDASLYYTINVIVLVATRLLCGKLADRFSPVITTAPAMILGALGYVCLLLSSQFNVLFFVAGGLIGLCSGLASPTLNAEVIKRAPAARRGVASATYMMSFDVGIGAGSFIWGLFIDNLGFGAVFGGCIVCMLVACVLSVVWLKEKKN